MGLGSGFEADPDILHKHTTAFDRILAKTFYWLWVFSGFGMLILMVLDWIFNFD